ISRCIATARERIPGSIDNDVTGVSECSQQRGNLKDDGYILLSVGIFSIGLSIESNPFPEQMSKVEPIMIGIGSRIVKILTLIINNILTDR
ncbi:hypothetical protein, partial [Photorhabdus bodei]|uniref:hypothetical protein n=1 Tax=Photorhabdus bodei TaxID=2029681 RepID=UPI001E59A3FE